MNLHVRTEKKPNQFYNREQLSQSKINAQFIEPVCVWVGYLPGLGPSKKTLPKSWDLIQALKNGQNLDKLKGWR